MDKITIELTNEEATYLKNSIDFLIECEEDDRLAEISNAINEKLRADG